MSTLRRSNSSSQIPRLSRAITKQSSTLRSRSSSIRPSSATPRLLVVPGLGTFGRSSSYSNLVTPSQKRIVATTPTSSAYKVNNKEWQKTQFQKVKHFFTQMDPNMPVLKPLSIKAYIYSMDILFKLLDNRISITPDNFKDSVPEYLKSFKYPHQLKPSVIKSPAVPSSWQYILQIWLWLIDLIDVVQNSENIFLSQTPAVQLLDATVSHMSNRFISFNSKEDEESEMKENQTIDKQFIATLAEVYNVGDVDAEDEEEAHIDNQLEITRKAFLKNEVYKEELVKKIQSLSIKNQERCQQKYDRRNELLAKIKEFTIVKKNNEIALKECKEKNAQLENIIASQNCTKGDMKQSKDKMNELSHRIQLLKQRREKQTQLIESHNSKLIQEREKLESMIFEINNKTSFSGCKVQLQELKICEDDLFNSDLPKNLQSLSEKIKAVSYELCKELEEIKTTLDQKKEENKNENLKVNKLECELEKLCKIEEKCSNVRHKQIEMYRKQVENGRLRFTKKQKELEELISKKPDVEKVKREIEISTERLNELKSIQEETITKTKELFIWTNDIIKQTQERLKEIMNGVTSVEDNNLTEAEEYLEKIREI